MCKFEDYVKAHNDRDLDAIKAMNVDTIKYGAQEGNTLKVQKHIYNFLVIGLQELRWVQIFFSK